MPKTLKKGSGGINPDHVKQALRDLNSNDTDMQELRGDRSGIMKLFEDRGGHKGALRLVAKLKRMEATAVDEFLRCFESYCHIAGLLDQTNLLDVIEGGKDGKADHGGAASAEAPEAEGVRETPEAEEDGDVPGEEELEGEIDLVAIEEAGKEACRAGLQQADNPYDEDDETEQREAWADGWIIAFNKGEAPAEVEGTDAA